MKQRRTPAVDHLAKTMMGLEDQFKLGRGFLPALLNETDWSFIIKVHALVEAAVSYCLTTSIDRKLSNIFDRLELSDLRIGKTQFAEALGIISKDQKAFVRKISEIRNLAVHNVNQINMNLQNYLQGLDSNQKNALVEAITKLFAPSVQEKWRSDCIKDLKSAIWVATMVMIAEAASTARIIDAKRKLMHTSWKYVEAIRKSLDVQNKLGKDKEST